MMQFFRLNKNFAGFLAVIVESVLRHMMMEGELKYFDHIFEKHASSMDLQNNSNNSCRVCRCRVICWQIALITLFLQEQFPNSVVLISICINASIGSKYKKSN